MNNSTINFIKYYLPAIIWAGVIFFFSSIPNFTIDVPKISTEIILRKLAHIAEYGVFSWLVFRIFYKDRYFNFKSAAILSLAFTILFAVSDELHQLFVAGRAGKVIDVFVDVLGGLLAIEIISFFAGSQAYFRKIMSVLATGGTLFIIGMFLVQEGEKLSSQKALEEALRQKNQVYEEELLKQNKANNYSTGATAPSSSNQTAQATAKKNFPVKFQLKVPFTSQAPLANWDEYHEEACEEASLIILNFFLEGKKFTPQIADQEIMRMINFEIERYGNYKDTNAQQSVDLYNAFYGPPDNGKRLEVIYDIKRDDLKYWVSQGFPVIVPAAGRLLGNPNYTAPGPPYHMLVLTGYDGNTVVTNDPGTRKGENYRYNLDVFYNAVHDFPGNLDQIQQGRKAIIVVK